MASKRVISIDKGAAWDAALRVGKNAASTVGPKLAEGTARATRGVKETTGRIAEAISSRTAKKRQAFFEEASRRTKSAIQGALRKGVELSKKQQVLLEGLEERNRED